MDLVLAHALKIVTIINHTAIKSSLYHIFGLSLSSSPYQLHTPKYNHQNHYENVVYI